MFIASLRCTYVQPRSFGFGFCSLRLASSSSDNVGNLSFSLLLLKRSREMEKNWQICLIKFRHCQIIIQQVYRADTMLCVDWVISIACCFFMDLIG